MAGDFDLSDDDFEEEKVRCVVCKRKFFSSLFGSAQIEDDVWVCSEECYERFDTED